MMIDNSNINRTMGGNKGSMERSNNGNT